jgi:hypothetical protein
VRGVASASEKLRKKVPIPIDLLYFIVPSATNAGMKSKIAALFAVIICLCASITFAPSILAQNGGAMAKLEMLSKELQLTPEQKGEMLPILKEEGPKLEAIKKNTSMTKIEKARELHAIHSQTAPQMQKILSPAQYQKLQAIREQEIRSAIEKKGH